MKIGRNDLCPCGSGKKYKKCCLGKTSLNKANEKKGTRDSDFGFVIESIKLIDTREELERVIDSHLEESYIQQELFQDAISNGMDNDNFDQTNLKEQKTYNVTTT